MINLLQSVRGCKPAVCYRPPAQCTQRCPSAGFLSSRILHFATIAQAKRGKTASPVGDEDAEPAQPEAAQSAAGYESYEALLVDLDAVPYFQLQARLKELGLPATGKKATIAERLADALWKQREVEQAQPQAQLEQQRAPLQPAAATLDAALEEDSQQIRAELDAMATEELVSNLEQLGMSTQGARQDLIDRLHTLLLEDAASERALEGAGATDSSAFTPEEREMLMEARTKLQYQELLKSPKQDVYHELKQSIPAGEKVPSLSHEKMAQQVAAIRASAQLNRQLANPSEHEDLRDELESILAGGTGAVEGEVSVQQGFSTGILNCGVEMTPENADANTILGMTPSAIKKLKLHEARVALSAMGVPESDIVGTKYMMIEKLLGLLMGHKRTLPADVVTDAGARQQTVEGMSLRDLRSVLAARGLPNSGSRATLEARLEASLAAEGQQLKEQAEKEAEKAAAEVDLLSELTPSSMMFMDDPNVIATVLFGAPRGSLEDLQASLDAATCAAAALHTAWPPASDPLPANLDINQDAGTSQDTSSSTSGVRVRLVYVQRDLSAVEIAAPALQGLTAADLLAGVPFNNLDVLKSEFIVFDSVSEVMADMREQLQLQVGDGAPLPPKVLLSVLSVAGMSAAESKALSDNIAAGADNEPVIGTLAHGNKLQLASVLKEHGFPVLPQHVLAPKDVQDEAAIKSWTSRLEQWADKQGYHSDHQQFIIKPAHGTSGHGVIPAAGVTAAARVAQQLMATLQRSTDNIEGQAVLVEPFMADSAMHVCVHVIDSPDGPVALLPTEIEISDVEQQLFDSELALQEHLMMREGYTPEEINERLAQMRAQGAGAAGVEEVAHHHRKPTPFTRLVKYHNPPRLPRNLVHALRHSAALAYKQLGLQGGARLDGWVAMEAGWQEKYERHDDGLGRLLPDGDPNIIKRVIEEQQQADAIVGQPLSEYYNADLHVADLSRFNARTRLHASHNKEGTVFLTDVNPGLDLDPASPLFMQAAELGMSHTAVLRNVVNGALRAAASRKPASRPASRAGTGKTLQEVAAAADSSFADDPADSTFVQLQPPMPIDPLETAPLLTERPDDFDILQAVTEWREERWVLDKEREHDREQEAIHVVEVAEIIEEALSGQPQIPYTADGEIDMTQLPYAYAQDITGFDGSPAQATPVSQDVMSVQGVTYEQQAEVKIEALRERFPGLPEEDLMYVMLGEGPEGQAIDTDKLERVCKELRAQGGTYIAVDALEDCYIDPSTGQELLPQPRLYGPEAEPGGYISASVEVPYDVAEKFMRERNKFANARSGDPRRVWLLIGGSDEGATQALRDARYVALQLSQCLDVQVEVLMLDPDVAPANQEAVRSTLLARRTDWMATGLPVEEMSPFLELDNIRNTPQLNLEPYKELVWALTPAQLLHHNAASVRWASEAALQRNSVAYHAQPALEQQALQVRQEVQMEVAAAGVDSVAGQWGGQPTAAPPAPRLLNVSQLVEEAADVQAVVVPLLRGCYPAVITQLLQDHGVLYTGPSPVSVLQCSDKHACSQAVADMEEAGVTSVPSEMLVGSAIVEAGNDETFAQALFEEICSELASDEDNVPKAICVRPVTGSGGLSVAKITCGQDLMLYGQALGYGLPELPANALSEPHRAIPMSRFAADAYVVSIWVDTDNVTALPSNPPGSSPAVQVEEVSNWVEVSICMLGGLGTMEPLGVSVLGHMAGSTDGVEPRNMLAQQVVQQVAAQVQQEAEQANNTDEVSGKRAEKQNTDKASSEAAEKQDTAGEQQEQPSQSAQSEVEADGEKTAPARVYVTPAPEDVLKDTVLQAVVERARGVADYLALQGLVRLDAFVSRETGELMVIEVDTCPSLEQGSLVYAQAMQRQGTGLSPAALLREVINLGTTADRQPEQDASFISKSDVEEEELLLADEGELDEGQAADLDVFGEDMVEVGAGEDMMEDLAALQGVSSTMLGPSDANELYLSSSGRAARRGKPARSSPTSFDFGVDDLDDDMGVIGDQDFDIDGQGTGPDADLSDNWAIRGAMRE